MAYCEEFRRQRRCTATKRDGTPCRGWAVWGGDVCLFHGGKPLPWRRGKHRRPPCHCGTNGAGGGYRFPHKRGGGTLCIFSADWNEPIRTIGPSEHSWSRLRGAEKRLVRMLKIRGRYGRRIRG